MTNWLGRDKLPKQFQRCLIEGRAQQPFTDDLTESLWLFSSINIESY